MLMENEHKITRNFLLAGAKLAGMGVDEFNELRIKAGILAVD